MKKKETGVTVSNDSKQLTKSTKKAKKKKKAVSLTQNEVEAIYTLPDSDMISAIERKRVSNRYYLKISERFHVATFIVILIFAAFLIGAFIMFRSDITLENFRYLMRNVNFKLETRIPSSENDGIVYDAYDNRVFSDYRDYIATAGKSQLIISDITGNKSYAGSISYKTPVLRTSETYLACFDLCGNEFSLYTYFTQVKTDKTNYPIYDMSVSDNGYYAISTSDDLFAGIVEVYNNNFKQITRIKKNKYIVSADISKDGKNVVVARFGSNGQGVTISEIALHPTDSKDTVFTLTFEDTVPREARYLEDGTIAFLTTENLIFISPEGNTETAYSYKDKNVKSCFISKDSVLFYSSGIADTLSATLTDCMPGIEPAVFNAKGTCKLISKQNGKIYYYNGKTLTEFYRDGSKINTLEKTDIQGIISDADGNTLICGRTRIESADFPEKEIINNEHDS